MAIGRDRHGPARLENYLNAHNSHMDRFRVSGFVDGDSLGLEELPAQGIATIKGEIACLGCIVIRVFKILEILEGEGRDAMVQTVRYSYNVSIRLSGQRGANIFRYDNAHSYKDHPDDHHKHYYDWHTGRQLEDRLEWIGEERWPHLSEVIAEAHGWYASHLNELDHPEDYPTLRERGKLVEDDEDA